MYPLLAEVGPQAILVALADAAMKGTLLLMLAALYVLTLRKASAATRHLVWTGALTAALVLPLMSFLLPAWHVPWLPNLAPIRQSLPSANLETEIPSTRLTTPNLTNETASVGQNAQNSLPTTGNPASVVNDTPASAPFALSQRLKNPFSSSSIIFSIWMIGALLALSPLLIGWVLIAKVTRRAAVETSLQWQQSLSVAMSDLNLRRKVRLHRGASVKMPMTWGAWAPVLLLPEASDKWAESRRRAVLLHELAHIKRWDWLTQTLASVACALYWFNPIVWIAARQMRHEREQACDDLVLRRGLLPSDYAEELVQLAADGGRRGLLNCVAVPIARHSTLERRVRAILDGRRNRAALTQAAVLSVLALVVVVTMPIAMLRAAMPSASISLPSIHQEAAVDAAEVPHLTGGVYDGQQHGLNFVELSMAQLGRQTAPATFRYHWDLPSPDWVPPAPPPPIKEVSAVLSRVATVWQFHKQFNFADPGGNFVDANGESAAVADADYFVFDDDSSFHREISDYMRGEAQKFVADWIAGWDESLVQPEPGEDFHLVKSTASLDATSYEGVDTELICCTPNIVSLLETPYESRLGMRQPAIKLNFVNQGSHAQSFTESDLFVPDSGWEKRLSELCLRKFTDADLMGAVADGTLTSLSPDELSEFAVTPAALRIYLNLGEDGLSSGETGGPDREVDIPWSELRGYLRPDGPARFLTDLLANLVSK